MDRLHHHGRRPVVDPIQFGRVVEVDEVYIGQQRSVAVAFLLVARDAQGAVRASVVALVASQQSRSSGDAFGQLQRGFDRFGTTVHEVHAVQFLREQACEPFGVAHLRLLHELPVRDHMQVAITLLLDRSDHFRVPVPGVVHRKASDKVQVSLAIAGSKPTALGMYNVEGYWTWTCLRQVLVEGAQQFAHDHYRGGKGRWLGLTCLRPVTARPVFHRGALPCVHGNA